MTRKRYRTTRNLTGMAALLAVLFVYAFAASAFGEYLLPEDAKILQALYFIVAGIGWIIPAIIIIKWMLKPAPDDAG